MLGGSSAEEWFGDKLVKCVSQPSWDPNQL
jgi:hypothetical protein